MIALETSTLDTELSIMKSKARRSLAVAESPR
jgi:hypothetical protein